MCLGFTVLDADVAVLSASLLCLCCEFGGRVASREGGHGL